MKTLGATVLLASISWGVAGLHHPVAADEGDRLLYIPLITKGVALPGLCMRTLSIDEKDDGSIDKREIVYYTDDPEKPSKMVYERNANRICDVLVIYSWDTNGNLTEMLSDGGCDGTIDNVRTYQYVDGRVISYRIDRNNDSVIDYIKAFEYDPMGQLIHVLEDTDNDGEAEQQWRYIYRNGKLHQRCFVIAPGEDCDWVTTYTWGPFGVTETLEEDVFGGELTLISNFYRADGKLLLEVVGDPRNGSTRVWTEWSYFPDGNLRCRENRDSSGLAESKCFAYDELKRLTREDLFHAFYGRTTQSYVYSCR